MTAHPFDEPISRRALFGLGARGLAGGFLGLSLTEYLFARRALAATRQAPLYDAVIQVFLEGGASQLDTWCAKPGSKNTIFPTLAVGGTEDPYTGGGPLHVTENLSQLAGLVGGDPSTYGFGRVDGMVIPTADHEAAQNWTNCYTEGGLADQRPAFAAVGAHYLAREVDHGLPSVVVRGAVGVGANDAKGAPIPTALLADPWQDMSALMRPSVPAARFERRQAMRRALGALFRAEHPDRVAGAWSDALDQAHAMTTSGKAAQAFDLSGVQELPGQDRGITRPLTVAQRLVSQGVPLVTVGFGGQDLHSDLRAGIRRVWRETLDPAVTALARNLARTGKRVLISFVTEFGRSPTLAGEDGRDHWPGGYTHALLSINQPRFKSTCYGYTGPDGEWSHGKGATPIQDQVRLGPYGAFLWRTLGIDVDLEANHVPMVDGTLKPPVWSGYYVSADQLLERFFRA